MYLYFNKQGELTTKIPHGEPIRQGNPLNLYVCFPLDFTDELDMNLWSVFVEVIKSDNSSDGVPYYLENKGQQPFYKLKDSEVTYDLIDGETYHTFFVSIPRVTNLPGNLNLCISLTKEDILFYQETATVFVEKTFGFNNVDITIDEDQFEILRNEYRDINKKYNELKQTKVSIVDTTDDIVYGKGNQGKEITIPYTLGDGTPYTIVLRDDEGKIGGISDPTKENHAVNKKYVDEEIKELEENIDEKIGLVFVDGILTETQVLELWTNKPDGRYNITSEMYGPEILILYHTDNLFKRMTGEADYTYDFKKEEWKLASGAGGSMNEISGVLSEEEIVALWGEYPDGFYTITSQTYGKEMIVMTRQLVIEGETDDFGNPKDERLFKRITGEYDYTYDFESEEWEVSSGTGGGTSGTIQLVSISALEHDIAKGNELNLEFRFKPSTGTKGTLQIYVNNFLKKSQAISKGITSVEVSNLLKVGTNDVTFKVSDTVGSTISLEYLVNVIELTLQSNFNDLIARTGDFEFKYTPSGKGTKNITFKIDGNKYGTVDVVQSSGVQQTKIIGGLTHGVHTLEVVAEAYVGDVLVPSNKLKYNIMYFVDGNDTILISSKFEPKEVTRGELINIEYVFYNPTSPSSPSTVNKYINGEVYEENLTQYNEKLYPFSTTTYPAGIVTFTIDVNGTRKSFEVLVNEFEDNILPIETNLELKLIPGTHNNDEPEETRKHWVFNGIDTELIDFNWSTNGWHIDKNGIKFLRFNGKAKATIGLNSNVSKATYLPFDKQFTDTGKVFEFEFVARDVNDVEKPLITCMNGNVGFEISSNKCVFGTGEKTKIITKFKDEEKVRITFVVQKYSNELGNANLKLVKCLLNGVVSGLVRYEINDSWIQSTPTGIEINPNAGAIDIYSIRIYNADYSDKLLLENYIADMNLADKIQAITRNNIIDESTQSVSYSKIKDLIPILIIQGVMPMEKLGDEVEKPKVKVSYFDPFDSNNNFEYENVEINVQGTSSKDYPRKNYKLKFPIRFSFYQGAVPEKTYTMKADYMESSHSHNTGNAIIMNNLSPKFPTQIDLEGKETGFRNAINGFPIVIFNQPEGSEDLIYYGVFNFNNDKGNSRTLGLDEDLLNELVAENKLSFDYPLKPQSWEFKNNTSNRCQFLSGDFTEGDWTTDFEARYHYSDENDYTDLKRVVEWVASTDTTKATNVEFETPIIIASVEYTADTEEYRKVKFKNEFSQHFDLDFCLFYYIMMDVILGVDSRAKNMFLDTLDGQIWYPRWYDIDTAYGVNNQGRLVFGYNFEQNDLDENGAPVFNASESVLWNNFGEAYKNEIKIAYLNLRTSGKLSYESLMDVLYGQQISKISEAMYNTDGEFKYIDVFDISKLPQGTAPDDTRIYAEQGTRLNHLQWWLSNRIAFLDSKYFDTDSTDKITMRTNKVVAGDSSIDWDNKFEIMPFTSMYINVKWGSNYKSERGNNNEYTTMDISKETFSPSGTEVDIYGASRILNVKGFDTKYVEELNVTKATRLVELNVGNGTSGYKNSKLTSLTIGNLTKLEKVDIQNCSSLVSTLDLSGCANIKEIYAKGSAITGVLLADGGNLQTIELPATVTTLTLQNQPFLNKIELENYSTLESLFIDNVPQINSQFFLLNAKNLKYLRLINIDWTDRWALNSINYSTIMDLLYGNTLGGLDADGKIIYNKDENGNDVVKKKPYISGTIYINDSVTIEQRQLNAWNEHFAEYGLTIEAAKSELGNEVKFINWDGTILQVKYVLNGQNVEYTGPEPTRPDDGEVKYTFVGWDKVLENVTEDLIVNANFIDNKPTKLTLELDNPDYLKPTIRIGNFVGKAYINWGDTLNTEYEQTVDINTSSYASIQHIYNTVGVYEIKILLQGRRYKQNYKYDLTMNMQSSTSFSEQHCDIWLYNDGSGSRQAYSRSLKECELQEHIFDRLHPMLLIGSKIKQFVVPYSIDIIGGAADVYSHDGIPLAIDKTSQIFYQSTLEDLIILNPNTKFGYNNCGFYACTKLKCITNSLNSIDDVIHLPNNLKEITGYMFGVCRQIESVIIPDSVTSIGSNAFNTCTSLPNITIPDSVTSIGYAAFYWCSSLESIIIPDSVTSIGSYCFERCNNLTEVKISENEQLTTLPAYTFYYCESLSNIVIPNNITKIDNSCFHSCSSLEHISFPPNLTSIGSSAFYSCDSLVNVEIPDNVESLGADCFDYCNSLINVTLPANLKTFGNDALGSSGNAGMNIYYNNTLTNWCKVKLHSRVTFYGTIYFKNENGEFYVPDNIIIPDDITEIGDYQFCKFKIKSCTLNSYITKIGKEAFYDCSSLSTITNTNNVEELGSFAFAFSKINSFDCSENLKIIPDHAFYSCNSLTSINLSDNVTHIKPYAFYATHLTEINLTDNIEELGAYAFSKTRIQTVVIPPKITHISAYLFESSSLTQIEFHDDVQSIGDNAFYNCINLINIDLPENLETIDTRGLSCGATGKTNITFNSIIPPKITSDALPPVSYVEYLYIPAGYINVFKQIPEYSAYSNKFKDKGFGLGPIDISWVLLNSVDTILVPYGNDSNETPILTVSSSDEQILSASEPSVVVENPGFIQFNIQTYNIAGSVDITLSIAVGSETKSKVYTIDVYDELPSNRITVEDVSGAYKFELNENGYYESTNAFINSSYALCKVNIYSYGDQIMYVDCISNGENQQDFGILSELNKTLLKSSTIDDTNVKKSFRGLSSSSVQTVDYGQIDKGSQYIYIKYRKDSTASVNSDTLQFKIRFEKVTA